VSVPEIQERTVKGQKQDKSRDKSERLSNPPTPQAQSSKSVAQAPRNSFSRIQTTISVEYVR
jgi:hypothetical protein